MPFLKQVATMDKGAHDISDSRLIPNTEPTGTAYVAWKAKNYSNTLAAGTAAHAIAGSATQTHYRCKWNLHQMLRYQKILKREAKTNATRMAA